MNKHLFHKILYSFAPSFIEMGSVFLKEGDNVDSIFIVVSGTLEIFTSFEGNDFVIDRLHRGSVLNYRVIFNEDKMKNDIRATENTHLL
jgi:CRP-like cAMP-binding protein